MTKLTKADVKERDRIASLLDEKFGDLECLVAEYNKVVLKAYNELQVKVAEYEEALAEGKNWASEIASRISDYVADKSEKWQQGERGDAFLRWSESYDNVDLELQTLVEAPEELDMSGIDNHAETLTQLPEEPE